MSKRYRILVIDAKKMASKDDPQVEGFQIGVDSLELAHELADQLSDQFSPEYRVIIVDMWK